MKKVLFVCQYNQNRSVAAEHLFKDKFETKSAGLVSGTIVSKAALEWADIVYVMEDYMRDYLNDKFAILKSKVICLDIPNIHGVKLKYLLLEKVDLS